MTWARRFTMVEIMMVVAIIAAIAAIGVGIFNFSSYKIAETRTAGLINKLDAALSLLYTKYHMYPQPCTETGDVGFLVLGCDRSSSDDTPLKNLKKYGALKNFPDAYINDFIALTEFESLVNDFSEDAKTSNCVRIVDAWGRPLFYRAPGNVRTRGFDLCSAGLDGKFYKEQYTEQNFSDGTTIETEYIVGDDGKSTIKKDGDAVSREVFFSNDFGDDILAY